MRNHVIICARWLGCVVLKLALVIIKFSCFFESHAIRTFADDRFQTDNKMVAGKPKNGDCVHMHNC